MGIKVNYGKLESQSSSMATVSASRVAALQQLISAFAQFQGAPELMGNGYDAAKNYAGNVMVAYYQGAILYSEAVADAANFVTTQYASYCGGEDLDEDQLQTELDGLSRSAMAKSASITGLESIKNPTDEQKTSLKTAQAELTKINEQVTKVQEKLQNLRDFSAAVASATAEADACKSMLTMAEATLGANFSGGNFDYGSTDYSWIYTSENKWSIREETHAAAYQEALRKIANGEPLNATDATAIERYSKEHPEVVGEDIQQAAKDFRKMEKDDVKYRAIEDKAESGKELSNKDESFIKGFSKKYPNRVSSVVSNNIEEKNKFEKLSKEADGRLLTEKELKFTRNYINKHPKKKYSAGLSNQLEFYVEAKVETSDGKVSAEAEAAVRKKSWGDDDNGASVTAMKVEGSAEASVPGLSAEDGEMRSSFGAEAEVRVTGVEAEGHGQLGDEDTNIHGDLKGSYMTAGANAGAHVGLYRDKNGDLMADAKAEAGAEAYLLKGEATAGFTVFGFDVDLTGSAGLGVAAKAEVGLRGQSAEAGFKVGPVGLELNVTKA